MGKIAQNYLKNGFYTELLLVIPLPWILLHLKYSQLLYFIKCYRIFRGFTIFDVGMVLDSIKGVAKERIEKRIQEDPKIGDEIVVDHNNIESLLMTNYFLQIFKLVITILSISYFVGMIWLTFCVLSKEISQHYFDAEDENNFLDYFGISDDFVDTPAPCTGFTCSTNKAYAK